MFSKWISVIALVLAACQPRGPVDEPLLCELEDQDVKVCGECASEFRPSNPSPELEAFDDCYDDVARCVQWATLLVLRSGSNSWPTSAVNATLSVATFAPVNGAS